MVESSVVQVMEREAESFRATERNGGLREARLEAAGPLYEFLESLRSREWVRGDDVQADRLYAARLGLLTGDDCLRDAVLCKILMPDLDAGVFREVATAGYATLDTVERVMEHVYEHADYDVREQVGSYHTADGMPALLAGAVAALPPDWRRGALEVAAFTSWAQGDNEATVNEYCARLFAVQPYNMMGSQVSAVNLKGVRPAFVAANTRTDANFASLDESAISDDAASAVSAR
jgi:hypothetical protein